MKIQLNSSQKERKQKTSLFRNQKGHLQERFKDKQNKYIFIR